MKYCLLAGLLLATLLGISQAPQLFKYQGLARAADGTPLADSAISIRISIHKDSPAGTVVYRETHNVVTNTFGTFSINIGGGVVNLGTFSTIPWSRHLFFQEVELNNVSMGTAQYLSVPYALATDSARNARVADSAKNGIAPFKVRNFTSGNDTVNVAIIAIGNNPPGGAPVLYCENLSPGTVFHAQSGNGIYIGSTEQGFETNGRAHFGGNVFIQDTLSTGHFTTLTASFNTLKANTIIGQTGNVLVSGSLAVTGNLSKGSGSFKIDHPLDPLNKYLYHSFVESPDMKNIYDGIIMTGNDGKAIVKLPDYFESLNKDFRYQLTPVGQFAEAIVLTEVKNNQFVIQTDKPFVKISWQVTGIRKDVYAEKYPIIPEVEKTAGEKGKYLYPAAYRPE